MADRPLLAAFRWRCTLLIRSRSATAALRVVSCRAAVHSLGRGCRPGHSLTLAPGLRGTSAGPARCAGPRQDTPAGPPATPPADPAGRPAGRRERKTKHANQENGRSTAPPGHLPPLAWPGGSNRLFPAAAAPVPPRGHQKHVSTLRPPFPPIPPSHLNGFAVQRWAAIEIRGEGRTPGALTGRTTPQTPR